MKPTTPATQLEIAAQWLKEASLVIEDRYLKWNLKLVADECLAIRQKATGGGGTGPY